MYIINRRTSGSGEESRVQGFRSLGISVECLMLRVSGFRVFQGLGFRVFQGLGFFRVQGLGFRVFQGLGFRGLGFSYYKGPNNL